MNETMLMSAEIEEVINDQDFLYREYGNPEGEVILLLHGLMGGLSNFSGIVDGFQDGYRIIIPQLPIFSMPLVKLNVIGLLDYVDSFVEYKQLKNVHVLGNSLGGHLAQLYTMRRSENVGSMILTGSSGLFENAMGKSFPKRGSYDYIKEKAEDVFYDPKVATKELVDSVFKDVNDRNRAIRILKTAKSAIRHNLGEDLHNIMNPTLLIWGKQDTVTPPFVGEKFHELIPNSELHFIDQCGHAPMMERPNDFNQILKVFLDKLA